MKIVYDNLNEFVEVRFQCEESRKKGMCDYCPFFFICDRTNDKTIQTMICDILNKDYKHKEVYKIDKNIWVENSDCHKCVHYKVCKGFASISEVESSNKRINEDNLIPCPNYLPATNLTEVSTAKWVEDRYETVCSNCENHALFKQSMYGDLINVRTKRCPHCGAIMTNGDYEE